jgi:hypothetical protein
MIVLISLILGIGLILLGGLLGNGAAGTLLGVSYILEFLGVTSLIVGLGILQAPLAAATYGVELSDSKESSETER